MTLIQDCCPQDATGAAFEGRTDRARAFAGELFASAISYARNRIKRATFRRRLLSLDDHMLRDVGLTRNDVYRAVDLPLGLDAGAEMRRERTKVREANW